MPDQDVVTNFSVRILGYGDAEKVVTQQTLSLCKSLYNTFGERAEVYLLSDGPPAVVRHVTFSPMAREGGVVTVVEDEAVGASVS